MTNETDTKVDNGNSTEKPTATDLTPYEKLKLWVTHNKFKSCLLVVFVLMFFSRDWDGKFSWKEEVRLPDGEIIWVKRWVDSSWSQPIGGTGTFYLEGGGIEVLSDIADKPGAWEFPALPVLIFRDANEEVWTTVATWPDTLGHLHFYKAPYPKHMYVMHQYVGGEWKQVEMDLNLIEMRSPLNLIREIKFRHGMPTLSLADKKRITQKPHHPRYRCLTERGENFNYKNCKSN